MIPMTACPKPRAKRKRARKPMQHGRLKAQGKRTQKSGGALFWKVKQPTFRKWLREENKCLLAAQFTTQRVTLNDLDVAEGRWRFLHQCWGVITPAHIGKHQANGAPDLGHCIPLCEAAHTYYDEHRGAWAAVTGYTEAKMQRKAEHYGTAYMAHQGTPTGEITWT